MGKEPRIRLNEPAVIFAVYYSRILDNRATAELTARLCKVLLDSIGDRRVQIEEGYEHKQKKLDGREVRAIPARNSKNNFDELQHLNRGLEVPPGYDYRSVYMRAGTQVYLEVSSFTTNLGEWGGTVPPAAFLTLMATEPPKVRHKDGMAGVCRDFFIAAENPSLASGYVFCDTLEETSYHDMSLSWERETNLQDWNTSDDSRLLRVRCPAWATLLGPALTRKVDPSRSLVERFLALDVNGPRSSSPGRAEYLPSGASIFITSTSPLDMVRPAYGEEGAKPWLRSSMPGINSIWLWQQFRRVNAI
jgi:hypothetical protein